MRLFGIHFEAKRLPKWAPYASVTSLYEDLQSLSEDVRKLELKVESQRVQISQGKRKDREQEEVDEVLEGGNGGTPVPGPECRFTPGMILNEAQIRLLRGQR